MSVRIVSLFILCASLYAAPKSIQQVKDFGTTALHFEPSGKEAFYARGVSLEQGGILKLTGINSDVRVVPMDGKRAVNAEPEHPLAGKSHYFLGRDPGQWRTNVPHFGRIRYRGVYAGIDLVYHANRKKVEYDFELAPHADPRAIRLQFHGSTRLMLREGGDLLIESGSDSWVQDKPAAYQVIDGKRQQVAVSYRVRDNVAAFELSDYDRSQPLTIDPTIVYSTFFGSTDFDGAYDIAVDPAGSAIIAGATQSHDLPGIAARGAHSRAAFITKFNPGGTGVLFTAYLGGSLSAEARGIALDATGNIYIAGITTGDFPILNAVQPGLRGGQDLFVAKLNNSANQIFYSTYVGGSATDDMQRLRVNASGQATVAGDTRSGDFPLKDPFRFYSGDTDGYAFRLSSDGSQLLFSTLIGGSGTEAVSDMDVDAQGNVLLGGRTRSGDFPVRNALQPACASCPTNYDGFIIKLNSAGRDMVYSTFLGSGTFDEVNGLTVDASGNAVATVRLDRPQPSPVFQVVGQTIMRISPDGSSFTILYRADFSGLKRPLVDAAGNIHVTSPAFFQTLPVLHSMNGSSSLDGDAIIAKFTSSGVPVYFTQFGGARPDVTNGIAVDSAGAVYLAGITSSSDFPVLNSIQPRYSASYDAFVTKLVETPHVTTVPYTFQASPASRDVQAVIDGRTYTLPVSFNWTTGSTHTASVQTQIVRNKRYTFRNWNNGAAQLQTITAAAPGAQLTANFDVAIRVTRAVSPPNSGTIEILPPPSSDGFHSANTELLVRAVPSTDFTFRGWAGVTDGNTPTTVVRLRASDGDLDTVIGAEFQPSFPSPPPGLYFVPTPACTLPNTLFQPVFSVNIAGALCGVPYGAKAFLISVGFGGNYYLTLWPKGQPQPRVSSVNSAFGRNAHNMAIVAAGDDGGISGAAQSAGFTSITVLGYFTPFNSGQASTFYPTTPCRIADTRAGGGTGLFGPPSILEGGSRTFSLVQSPCATPASATAYSLNLTMLPRNRVIGGITAWPAGLESPSMLILPFGQPAIATVTAAGDQGAVTVGNPNPLPLPEGDFDLIVDTNGYFAPASSDGLKFYTVTPCRVVDTRASEGFRGSFGPPVIAQQSTRDFPISRGVCGVPASARAYSLNVTVVPAAGPLQFLTVWPSGHPRPHTSTLNSLNGQIIANAALVQAGVNGAVSVFASNETHVVIDITGYFAP